MPAASVNFQLPSACLLLCRHYHASLTAEEREAVQAEWTNGDVPIIVATIAFGMGASGCWWGSKASGLCFCRTLKR